MIRGFGSEKLTDMFSSEPVCSEKAEIIIEKSDCRNVCYCDRTHRVTDEKYILRISRNRINVLCSGEKSAFYAVCDINGRMDSGSLGDGEFACSPSFRVRGYIEGFYGVPWTFEKRVSVMKLMALNRMNTVYYAPKDDDYHRDLWREKYPPGELEKLKRLVECAKEHYMDFCWCVAPGLSIKYSDEKEFTLLTEKTKQLYSAGIRNFGLLLDDINEDLEFEEDREKYSETVNAHIDLIEKYYAFLKAEDSGISLTVCPTLYHGTGTEYYISKLGKEISPEISVFWTGRDICSRELTSSEAIRFIEGTNHRPLYWDNYPVNDCAMFNEMHLSPIINRDPDLWKYSAGIISNCMEYAECSKIPLITIADYLWDSENYDYDRSWRNAIGQVIGRENTDVFMAFADHMRTSCLMDENSADFFSTVRIMENEFRKGNTGKVYELMRGISARMNACRELLKKDIPLFRELSKWIVKFNVACDIIEKVAELENGFSPEQLAEIEELAAEYESMPARLTEDTDIMTQVRNLLKI